jgi:hypothetical protein
VQQTGDYCFKWTLTKNLMSCGETAAPFTFGLMSIPCAMEISRILGLFCSVPDSLTHETGIGAPVASKLERNVYRLDFLTGRIGAIAVRRRHSSIDLRTANQVVDSVLRIVASTLRTFSGIGTGRLRLRST